MPHPSPLLPDEDTEAAKTPYLVSRNVTVAGRRTSIRLEPYMWDALRHIQQREGVSIHRLCTWIDERKPAHGSLTAAIRVFLLAYFRAASTEKGHEDAGHGIGNPLRNTPFEAAAPALSLDDMAHAQSQQEGAEGNGQGAVRRIGPAGTSLEGGDVNPPPRPDLKVS
ncbi:MAG TPA: ribbon-helix-helix domain-containing protein [Azospirillaceae bacterium]|nr:ribbon-helix-helix domain-containing protein [Azospirillaceae bacterium]